MTAKLALVPDRESAIDQTDKIELRVWLRLLTCTNMIESQVRTRLREDFDTTLPRFDLLAQLEREAQGLTMGELSSRLMVSGGNVTGLVDSLQREGLVDREPHPDDRRRQIIRLSAKGRTAFDAMTPVHEQWVDAMMAELDRGEMAELIRLLGKLKASIQLAGKRSPS
ncbi:MAG: MarR family transcriptional regulator [Rhodospirillales bacterium]|jgi:DNA-binding MarR family transcriptional regulator|nr:MarR family transcriptional regulator [Rhodospirillales bacterium]